MNILERYEPFFNPKSVIIIGASRNEYTFNGVLIKNMLEARYSGKIYIIHPFTEQLMGVKCYKDLSELNASIKEKPDLAIIMTQNKMIPNMRELGDMGIKNILLETDISVVFSREKFNDYFSMFREIIAEYNMSVVGPSMIGLMDFKSGFTTSIIPTRSRIISSKIHKQKDHPGLSYLAQSGGLSGASGWWESTQPIPISKLIHIGKAVDITNAQMIKYLFADPSTAVISLYLTDLTNDILDVLNEHKKEKPVLIKYCESKAPEKEEDNITKLQETGVILVENYIELFEFAKVFLWCPPPTTNGVGIIGPSSGAINLITYEMRKKNIILAKLEEENRNHILEKVGGSTNKDGNPVDYWPPQEFVGTHICGIYHNASKYLLKDKNVNAVFLALEFFIEIEFDFNIFEDLKEQYPDKTVICVTIEAEKEGEMRVIEKANALKIPVFVDEPERSVRALRALYDYYNIK